MTSDVTVNLSGSWSAKQRQNNGLDLVATYVRRQYVQGHKVPRIPVVGYIEYHEWKEPLSGPQLVVSIPVIEPALEADGSDPHGFGKAVFDALDKLRELRGKGSVDDVPAAGQIAGQEPFDFDGLDESDEPAETRLGPDGEHEVPPPSGEEIVAEREEAKAAGRKAKPTTEPFTPGGDA